MLLWKRWNFASKTGKKTYLSSADEISLKELFPRLFALSRNQHHCVASLVDSYVHPHHWNFGFRRNLNEVEVGELVRMLQILDRVRVSQYRSDSRRWKLDGSRLFSCKSYTLGKIKTCDHLQKKRPYMCLLPTGVLCAIFARKVLITCFFTVLFLYKFGGSCSGRLMLAGLFLKAVMSLRLQLRG
ncbi:unnamed protein product [Prunus brigantina]